MAETYGRLTGRAGVCSATLGPGAINLLLGVADATTNSTPLVALSAQVGMDRSYKESHQGVDLVSMFAPVTKWSALMATPGAAPEMVRKAFKLAQTERPGAVYLAVPEDVETSTAPVDARPLPVNVPAARRAVPATRWPGPPPSSSGRGPPGRAGRPRRRPGRRRSPPCVASPRSSGCRWPRPSTARASSPTTTPWPSGPSGSCVTTTSTSASTRPTWWSPSATSCRSSTRCASIPRGDKEIIHIHRFPAEVDRHYNVVGRASRPTSAPASTHCGRAVDRRFAPTGRPVEHPRPAGRRRSSGVGPTTGSRWPRPGSWPTPGRPWAARTSCWSTPGPSRCGWPGSTRPTPPTPA